MAPPRRARDPRWDTGGATSSRPNVLRLHSALLHVLRVLREVDHESGISPSRLSALSVLVFAGPMSQVALARAESMSAPSMSLLVRELESEGLVERAPDRADARRTIVSASRKGRDVVLRGRQRRLDWLGTAVGKLPKPVRRALLGSSAHLEALLEALRENHPSRPAQRE